MELLIEIIKQYGWQALVVSLFVFALIECIKPLARKIIKQTNVRHTVYVGLNYISTLGFSALFALLIFKSIDKTWALYGSAIVVVNILYPVIANLGFFNWIASLFKNMYESITENGKWNKTVRELAKALGVDEKILDEIATRVENQYLPKIKEGAEKFFGDNAKEVILNIKQKLAGFIPNEQLDAVAQLLFQKLAEAWVEKTEEVEVVEAEVVAVELVAGAVAVEGAPIEPSNIKKVKVKKEKVKKVRVKKEKKVKVKKPKMKKVVTYVQVDPEAIPEEAK